MYTKVMLAALCVFGIPAAAAAGDFYAGIGGGAYGVESGEFDDSAPTMGLIGGYRINQYVAFEASYLRMFTAEDAIGGSAVELDGDVWGLSTTLSYPLADRFQAFGRLGWSYYDTTMEIDGVNERVKLNDYGDDFAWAVGGNYDISDRLGLRAEYGQIAIDDGDTDFLSLSLTYGFGR